MTKTVYKEVASSGTVTVERLSGIEQAEYELRVGRKELSEIISQIAGGYRYPANMTDAEARDLYKCLHEFFGPEAGK